MKNRMRREIMKRAFIVFLATVVLFSNIDLTAFAIPEDETEEIIPEEETTEETVSGNDMPIFPDTDDEENIPEEENPDEESSVSDNDISKETEPVSVSANSPEVESDVEIQGAGSLGRALLNAVSADVGSSDTGYASSISEIVVSGTQAYVTYYTETPNDHTLVVGIYDESGAKQLAVGSMEVAAGIKETTLTLEGSIPEYFIIKGHMIETDTLRPLCESYESDDYTEKMQNFFAKTTEDFDEEKVLQFDETDNTNNFLVFSDAIKMISQNEEGTTNVLVSYDETNHIYIIENPDEATEGLETGDILSYTGNDDTLLLTEIVELEWNEDNTRVTVHGKEAEGEDIFRFIKIGADNPKDLVAAPASYSVMGISEEEEDPSADGELTERLNLHLGTDKFSFALGDGEPFEINWEKLETIKKLKDSGLSDEEIRKKLSELDVPEGVIDDVQNFVEKADELYKIADANEKVSIEKEDESEPDLELGMDLLFCADVVPDIRLDDELDVEKVEFKIWYKATMEGNMSISKTLETPKLVIQILIPSIPPQLLDIKFRAHFEMEGELEVKVAAECKGAYTFEKVGLQGELRATEQTHDVKPYGEINVTVSFSVVLSLSAKLIGTSELADYMDCTKEQKGLVKKLAGGDLLSITVTGKFGITVEFEYSNKDAYEDGMIHECWDLRYIPEGNMHGCISVTISPVIEFNLKLCAFWIFSASAKLDVAKMLPEALKEIPFYYSLAFEEGGCGKCKHRIKMTSDQIIITISDSKGDSIADANIYLWGNGNLDIRTDTVGNAVCYIRDGVQNIYIEKEGVIYSEQVNIPEDLVVEKEEKGVPNLLIQVDETSKLHLGTKVKEIYDGGSGEVYAALTEDGSLYMWGTNKYGQLGIGKSDKAETSPTTLPGSLAYVPIKVMDDVVEFHLSSDGQTCAAITEDNTLYMWGKSVYGRIGNHETEITNGFVNKPCEIAKDIKSFSFINLGSSSEFNCMYIKTEGLFDKKDCLYMWGSNANYIMSDEAEPGTIYTKPHKMLEDVKDVYAIDGHCFAVCEDGSLKAWGSNNYQSLGELYHYNQPTISISYIPGNEPKTFSKKLKKFYDEKTGEWEVKYCFDSSSDTGALIAEDGKLYMWGRSYSANEYYEDGTSEWKDLVEVTLDSSLEVEEIYGKNGNWIALMSDGSIYNWRTYQINVNTSTIYGDTEPVHMTQIEGKVKEVKIGGNASEDIGGACAVITEDNKLYMWGYNYTYYIGTGNQANVTEPVRVLPEEEIRDFEFACVPVAITKEDELYMWGISGSGTDSNFFGTEPVKKLEGVDKVIPYNYATNKVHFAVTGKNGNTIWSIYDSTSFTEQEMPAPIADSFNYSKSTYCIDLLSTGNVYTRSSFMNPELKYLFGDYKFLAESDVASASYLVSDTGEQVLDASVQSSLSQAVSGEAQVNLAETVSEENTAEQTASFTDLLPDEIYNIYAVKERTTDGCLATDNLLYIDQYVSGTDGTLSVTFEMRAEYDNPVIFCVPFKQTDIAEAEVRVEEITEDGHRHLPDVTVTYKDVILTEDRDYKIRNKASVIEAGEYRLEIEGIGLYTGEKTVTFTVKEDPFKDILPEDMPEGGEEEIPDGLWMAGLEEGGYVYTGKAIKPSFRVYDGPRLLTAGVDYSVSYRNNVKASNTSVPQFAPTIYISGRGNYEGRIVSYFTILPKSLSDEDVSASELYTKANNRVQKKIPTVTWNGKKLRNNLDYTVEYPDMGGVGAYKEPGTYDILIKGKGNFAGEKTVPLTITGNELISKATVAKIAKQAYTGSEVIPELTVRHGLKELVKDTDYTVTFKNNIKIGTATAVLTGIGDYSGTKTVTFEIAGTSLTTATVTGIPTTFVYSGEAITVGCEAWETTPELTVKVGGIVQTLVAGTDYDITYRNNINKGTALVTFVGINAYSGKITKSFRISAYDIDKDASEKINISLENEAVNFVQGGSRPKPVVKFGDTVLTVNKDYTLRYVNNTKINDGSDESKMPTIIIIGKGNFSGSVEKTFTIIGSDISEMEMTADDRVFVNDSGIFESEPVIVDTNGKKLKKGKDYSETITYCYKEDTTLADGVTVRKAGDNVEEEDIIPTGTVIEVIAVGQGDYEGLIKSEYRIVEYDISKARVNIEKQDYTGYGITLDADDMTVKYGDKELTLGTDYEIVSYKDNTNRGKAKVTIKGLGDFGGTKTIKFTIKSKLLEWWENVLERLFG